MQWLCKLNSWSERDYYLLNGYLIITTRTVCFHRCSLRYSPCMFIEWMNTLPAVLVPQFNCFVITGWHNQSIVWRKSTRNQIYISRSKHMTIFHPQASSNRERCMWKCVISAYLAQRTQLMCWLREKRNFCLWTVQTLMVLSSEAVTRVCPSLEKLTLRTEAVWALNDVDSAFL